MLTSASVVGQIAFGGVYSTLAQLALETGTIPTGMVVGVESTNALYMATQSPPVDPTGITTSTSAANQQPPNQVTYWLPIQPGTGEPGAYQSTPNTARALATSLAAYTGSGTGTLTASANGAIGTQDGVTLVAGDQLFIPAGLTNVTARDAGPWAVVSAGGASALYVLKRPAWFYTGNKVGFGATVQLGPEGGVFNNTLWRATAAPSTVIDTTDCAWYVSEFTFQVTLAAGTRALAAGQPLTANACPVGIFSATQSNFVVDLAVPGGTLTTTVGYGPANASSSAIATPGYSGTATFSVFALAAGQTTQTGDTSKVNVTIKNFA